MPTPLAPQTGNAWLGYVAKYDRRQSYLELYKPSKKMARQRHYPCNPSLPATRKVSSQTCWARWSAWLIAKADRLTQEASQ